MVTAGRAWEAWERAAWERVAWEKVGWGRVGLEMEVWGKAGKERAA